MTQRIVLPVSDEGLTGEGYRVERVTMANIADEPDEWLYACNFFKHLPVVRFNLPDLITGPIKYTGLFRDSANNVYNLIAEGRMCAPMIRVRFDVGRIVGGELLHDAKTKQVTTGNVLFLPGGSLFGLRVDHMGNPVSFFPFDITPQCWRPYGLLQPRKVDMGRVLCVAVSAGEAVSFGESLVETVNVTVNAI